MVLFLPTACIIASITPPTGLGPTNLIIKHFVETDLIKLDFELSIAAAKLSSTGLSGTQARHILNALAPDNPFVIDLCTTDPTGKMVTVAPDAYRSYESTDISTQEVTVKFNETKKPMLSQRFKAVEGMDAVVIMWPILSEKGDFMGSLSALFKPETLFTSVEEEYVTDYEHWKDTGISVDVMQLDGLNIYDYQGFDTGKNLFTDPEFQQYTELIALGHQIVTEEHGTGSYTIVSHDTGRMVKKNAYWSTIMLHDTTWRVVSTLQIAE